MLVHVLDIRRARLDRLTPRGMMAAGACRGGPAGGEGHDPEHQRDQRRLRGLHHRDQHQRHQPELDEPTRHGHHGLAGDAQPQPRGAHEHGGHTRSRRPRTLAPPTHRTRRARRRPGTPVWWVRSQVTRV